MTKAKYNGHLRPDPKNARRHSERNKALIRQSLEAVGGFRSIAVDGSNTIRAGNGVFEQAQELGLKVRVVDAKRNELIAVRRKDLRGKEAIRAAALDNLAADSSAFDYDAEILAEIARDDELIAQLAREEKAIAALLAGIDGKANISPEEARKTLAEKFIIPPFSVLDARQGYWQERKKAWIALGIESELGRGETASARARSPDPTYRQIKGRTNATPGGAPPDAARLENGHTVRGDGRGRKLARTFGSGNPGDLNRQYKSNGNGLLGKSEQARTHYQSEKYNANLDPKTIRAQGAYMAIGGNAIDREQGQTGTSIFDPVLCEIAYRWFCPRGAQILDPFAGGSVRGIVAEYLGYHYTGIDLRPEQIEANKKQAVQLDLNPRWIEGDSRNLSELHVKPVDFVFSCPPYFDLELYSDDPRDLSNSGEYVAFIRDYRTVVAQSVALLKPNRFGCFVVGDIRDKRGFYLNFVADTIAAFQDAGARLYNEAILVTAVGSLPIRIGAQFQGYRKLGKTHQNVLVFYKGNVKAIREFGQVEAGDGAIEPVSNGGQAR